MKDTTTITESVDAAVAYLASKGALGKLSTPCPVLYRDVVMWRTEEEESEESYDLPPLTVNRI